MLKGDWIDLGFYPDKLGKLWPLDGSEEIEVVEQPVYEVPARVAGRWTYRASRAWAMTARRAGTTCANAAIQSDEQTHRPLTAPPLTSFPALSP